MRTRAAQALALVVVALSVASIEAIPTSSTPLFHEKRQQVTGNLPQYALDYAPIVYLSSNEQYWPSSLSDFLTHVTPEQEQNNGTSFKPIAAPSPLTLANLNATSINSVYTYLTSNDNVLDNPSWLWGLKPDANGYSEGDVIIVAVDNSQTPGAGHVDVFYFYWYAYNQGPTVLGQRFGNHVGDWEYSMVRFVNGSPTALFVSAHADGEAYDWATVTKSGSRPITYSAVGTHANYVTSGQHNYVNGNPLIYDQTDRGVYWDPTLHYQSYWYTTAGGFSPTVGTVYPTQFLTPVCKWGDQTYPDSDPRQFDIFGQLRFTDGPTGPVDKNLNRTLGITISGSRSIASVLPSYIQPTSSASIAAAAAGNAPSAAASLHVPALTLALALLVGPLIGAVSLVARR